MSEDQLDKLEQKKKQLEKELHSIQQELDGSLGKMRSDVELNLDPVEFIRRHPLQVLGVSVLVGFLAGHKSRGADGDPSAGLFGSALWYELKRIATRKGVSMATDYIEQLLHNTEEQPSSAGNGVKKD